MFSCLSFAEIPGNLGWWYAGASSSCLCNFYVRNGNQYPASFPWPRTRYCSICPWLFRKCKSGARIFLLDSVSCLPPALFNACSTRAPSWTIRSSNAVHLRTHLRFGRTVYDCNESAPRANRTANANFTHGTATRRKNDGRPSVAARRFIIRFPWREAETVNWGEERNQRRESRH